MTYTEDPVASLPPPLGTAVERLRTWCADILNHEGEIKITAPLYHYTDERGLRGIFENERIWFTDYRHLNDPRARLITE